ncbi:DUF3558 family protein [Amycolatopsis sp. NPDC051758]|uniref:DUF3558 family protein n=1 Tax=Amycolatopsis sp. NPDC051758 TaxID=3363935 RepID=UPI003797B0DE
MALIGLVAVLSAAACASPTDTAPPGAAPAPAPITARPLDLTRYLAAPCSMVPVALTERLGLTRREERHENVLIGAGSQAQCRISAAPPLTGVAELRLYPASRPLPLLTGFTPAPTPTSVDAYPAGQWILSNGRDGSATSCHSIVDVAPSQGFSVLVNGLAGDAIENSCARARHLAESILAGQLV